MRKLSPADDTQARAILAIGVAQTEGASKALAELAHLDPDPARVKGIDADGLAFRGVFHLLAGDLRRAVADLTTSLELFRKGAPPRLACAPTAISCWPTISPGPGTTPC